MSLFSSNLSIYVSCFWPYYKKRFLFLSSPTCCICLFSLGFDFLVFFNTRFMLKFPYSWLFFLKVITFSFYHIVYLFVTIPSCAFLKQTLVVLVMQFFLLRSSWIHILLFCPIYLFPYLILFLHGFDCTHYDLRVEVTIIIISHSQKVRTKKHSVYCSKSPMLFTLPTTTPKPYSQDIGACYTNQYISSNSRPRGSCTTY